MAELRLKKVSKRWGSYVGVDNFNLDIADREAIFSAGGPVRPGEVAGWATVQVEGCAVGRVEVRLTADAARRSARGLRAGQPYTLPEPPPARPEAPSSSGR